MINTSSFPLNKEAADSDFTIESYRELLNIAKQRHAFSSYDAIPWGKPFLLWRHDCDYSLNRAHALAKIEASEGIQATYFLNPHSEFYNLFEKKQYYLVLDIVKMGHKIGLHFDAAFHNISNEVELSEQIRAEAEMLLKLYGVKPLVFSFHNPVAAHLNCDNEMYGGLVNCYSKRFKDEVSYCSDSNGYWRFRRLRDVLVEEVGASLQVLTHPDWWHELSMPPRQKIFRSAYGRASAAVRDYDSTLELHNRLNHAGGSAELLFLKNNHPRWFVMCDYLWNSDYLDTLFLELWRLYEGQIFRLCKAELHKKWKVPVIEINTFFEDSTLELSGSKLFKSVFAKDLHAVLRFDESSHYQWVMIRNQLTGGFASASRQKLEDGCKFLCNVIKSLGVWGDSQAINFDSIDFLEPIANQAIEVEKIEPRNPLMEAIGEPPNYLQNKWSQLKRELKKYRLGVTSE